MTGKAIARMPASIFWPLSMCTRVSADVAWSYGNFLLRQDEPGEAFREIRKAVELEPKRAAEAFSARAARPARR